MSHREVPALVLHALGALPRLETVTVDDPGPDEVRIWVAAAGICHTDVGYMQSARSVPVVLGHEGAGVVESVGARVTHVRPGDRVAVNWQPKCGRCRNCLRGRRDLCEAVLGTDAPRVHLQGAPLTVMLSAGVFCQLAVLPAGGAVPIDPRLPLEQAALLGCAVATGVGAALYTAQVQPGDDVVV
ncbi:MAG: alcohol dehydrogenase catalytic domain-containing protein, partial [Caldilineaceae bacterium]